jgi:hypothetical protein
VENFLREEVSRRISLREMREISSFKTDATFDITYVWGYEGRASYDAARWHEFLPPKFFRPPSGDFDPIRMQLSVG